MTQIVKNQTLTIYGEPGSGKTWFAAFLASQHRVIYSNFEITRYGKTVSNRISSIDDLERIPFCTEKGVAVIDEGGVNFNSRRSQSDANMEFGKLLMLGRKKNLNIITISQLERMTDVYARELSKNSFHMRSWFVTPDKLMFEYTVSKNGQIVGSKFVDLFEWSRLTGYSYNTLETSKMRSVSKAFEGVF